MDTSWIYDSDIDPGIKPFVKILADHGVETCQSCQGGEGHSYDWPTVDFQGGPGAGWHALGVCADFGLPVMLLQRQWTIGPSGQVDEVVWSLIFRHDALWWTDHCQRSTEDVRRYMRKPDGDGRTDTLHTALARGDATVLSG
jgi:hypothetical protein